MLLMLSGVAIHREPVLMELYMASAPTTVLYVIVCVHAYTHTPVCTCLGTQLS